MLDEILEAVGRCHVEPSAEVRLAVSPYRSPSPRSPGVHQLLVMLKPELTRAMDGPQPQGRELAWLVFSTLRRHGVRPGAAVVLSGAYVRRFGLVRAHYALLNEISREGLPRVRAAARARLREQLPRYARATDRVLGGHEFLHRFPEFGPRALDVLTQNLPVRKLGAGVYATEVQVDGVPWLVLNPFHPAQIDHFERAGGSLVVLECLADAPLRTIRREAVGATDPREAAPGSIRAQLLRRQPDLAWPVCTSRNAVHASPSSVEAMFALQRYFSSAAGPLPLDETLLGARLAAEGADLTRVQELARNPDVDEPGFAGPLFDVTEDLEPGPASDLVRRVAAARGRPAAGKEATRATG